MTKNINMYYLTGFVHQESRHGLAGCFCLQVSHEVAIRLQAESSISPEVSSGKKFASKLTHVAEGRIRFLLGSRTEGFCSSLPADHRPLSIHCHEDFSLGHITVR